jgi:hypothetical protein
LNGVNLGLIIAIVLAVSQTGLTIIFAFFRKQGNLETIIKQDCLFVENKSTHLLNYHFLTRRMSTAPNAQLMTREPEDLNTSRNLNPDFPKRKSLDDKELKLKENRIEGFENAEANMANDDVNQGIGEEVQIYNNFVARRDDVDVTHNENTILAGGIKIITMRDYECLTPEEMFIYDKRNLLQYLGDNLIRRNLILSVIFKHSIIDPVYIRIAKIIFSFSMLFGTNAFLLSNSITTEKPEVSI